MAWGRWVWTELFPSPVCAWADRRSSCWQHPFFLLTFYLSRCAFTVSTLLCTSSPASIFSCLFLFTCYACLSCKCLSASLSMPIRASTFFPPLLLVVCACLSFCLPACSARTSCPCLPYLSCHHLPFCHLLYGLVLFLSLFGTGVAVLRFVAGAGGTLEQTQRACVATFRMDGGHSFLLDNIAGATGHSVG